MLVQRTTLLDASTNYAALAFATFSARLEGREHHEHDHPIRYARL